MRRTTVLALVLAAFSLPGAQPASAAGIQLGLNGDIHVAPDLMGCAWIEADFGQTFVGTFTAVAVMQGPGTKVSTVRSVVPVSGSGSWELCLPGGHSGAVAGEGKFVLEAASATGELFVVKQCVIDRGVLTCV
jgi:hypothetical protein